MVPDLRAEFGTFLAGLPRSGLRGVALAGLLLLTGTGALPAAAAEEDSAEHMVTAEYRDGLRIKSADGDYATRIRWRAQMRLTDVTSSDLVGEEDGVEEENGFNIRRARFKADGHATKPWLKYFLEYGFINESLLTLYLEMAQNEKATLRLGQYKIFYNRERVDSSGKQQFVERSIVNSPFTVDRQMGPTLHGRLFKESPFDSRYAVGVFTGTGRGGDLDDDRRPMYLARWQWNFLGRDLGFSQSDVDRREKPAASLAFATVSNRSRFTRFSSSGGGQLPGFEEATESGQYKLQQWMGEFAWQGRGLSIQGEYHEKKIDDRVNDMTTRLHGWYAQAGYFFHEAWASYPKNLEFALRTARVDTDEGIEIPADREQTLVMNWFFNDHDHKITADVSHLKSRLDDGSKDEGWRARVQWDIQF